MKERDSVRPRRTYENKGELMQQKDKKRICDEDWDVITATTDGGVVWRRYGDRKIVVSGADETPEEALARDEGSAASGAAESNYAPGDYVKAEFRDEAAGIDEWMWCASLASTTRGSLCLAHARQRAA
jgi:hypothetical protein